MFLYIPVDSSNLSRRLDKICEDKSKNVVSLKQELVYRWQISTVMYFSRDNKIRIQDILEVQIIFYKS